MPTLTLTLTLPQAQVRVRMLSLKEGIRLARIFCSVVAALLYSAAKQSSVSTTPKQAATSKQTVADQKGPKAKATAVCDAAPPSQDPGATCLSVGHLFTRVLGGCAPKLRS